MVLGLIISAITFPGVIIHEYAHKKMCDKLGVDVYEVVYLQFGNPMGYVRHGQVSSFKQSFGITAAPFLVNSLFALGFYAISALYLGITGLPSIESLSGLDQAIFLGVFWLGFSSAMHAMPSSQDAKNLWSYSRSADNLSAKIGLPISGILYTMDKLRFFWIDAIYALVLWGSVGIILGV